VSRPRVVVVTNGNVFANLVLGPLLRDQELETHVVVTTGLRRQDRNRLLEAARLAGRWGPRLAAYKVATYAVPLAAQSLTRRPALVPATSRRLGHPTTFTRDVNDPDVVRKVKELEPDLLVSVSCPYKISSDLLSLPRIGAVNVHSSLLPRYAGAGTYVHVLAHGERATGVTVHEMVERFDAGKVLQQREIPIPDDVSVFALFARQCAVAGPALHDVLRTAVRDGVLRGQEQEAAARTWFPEPDRALVRRARERGHPLIRLGEVPALARLGGHG